MSVEVCQHNWLLSFGAYPRRYGRLLLARLGQKLGHWALPVTQAADSKQPTRLYQMLQRANLQLVGRLIVININYYSELIIFAAPWL